MTKIKNRKKQQRKANNRKVAKSRSNAVELLARAIELYEQGQAARSGKLFAKFIRKTPPGDTDGTASYYLGCIEKEKGRFDRAKQYFRSIGREDPHHINALFNLGGIAIDEKKLEKAEQYFLSVVSLSDRYTNAFYNLGIVNGEMGKLKRAEKFYRKALELEPEYALCNYNLGVTLLMQEDYEGAYRYFEIASRHEKNMADIWINMGVAMANIGNDQKAVECYEKAVDLTPANAHLLNNTGLSWQNLQHFDKAETYYEQALALDENNANTLLNLGNLYRARGDYHKAIEYYHKSLELEETLIGLANAASLNKEMNDFDKAYEQTVRMLQFKELKQSELANIHDTFIQICDWDNASKVIRRFKEARYDEHAKDVLAGSFMEFCAITDLSVDEVAQLHRQWGELTEKRYRQFEHSRQATDDAGLRKLRVGYISPDLHEHSVGYLIKDIIRNHNRDEFEIVCYSNNGPSTRDAFTETIIGASEQFKFVKNLSDAELAQEIFDDRLDVLIDLAGHTAGHRLKAMAHKPAPVQITYLGYPNTTGLSCIDYRITDELAEDVPGKDYRYSEKLIRLSNCFLTFNGFGNIAPVELKKSSCDQIVYGCFNNIQKLTPKAVELWARILAASDNAVLHLKAKQLNTRIVWNNIIKQFKRYGIAEERIKCLGYAPSRKEHLMMYNHIDIALDTFPYNGTVTTLEALWMNIPVVTLVGESHAQRVGHSILRNLGLDDLVAFSEEEYVEKSIGLARHPEKIDELKGKMRKNLIASSICNPGIITREIELNLKRIVYERANAAGRKNDVENYATADGYDAARQGKGASQKIADENNSHTAIRDASMLRMAMVKIEKEEFRQALDICRGLLGSDAVAPLAHYTRGVALYKMNDPQGALEALRTCLRLDSENSGARELMKMLQSQAPMETGLPPAGAPETVQRPASSGMRSV